MSCDSQIFIDINIVNDGAYKPGSIGIRISKFARDPGGLSTPKIKLAGINKNTDGLEWCKIFYTFENLQICNIFPAFISKKRFMEFY